MRQRRGTADYTKPRPDLTPRQRRIYASNAVKEMRARGLIADEPCLVCGTTDDVERHHPDRDGQPGHTIPLCFRDHRLVHAGKIPEPGTGRIYERRLDGSAVAPFRHLLGQVPDMDVAKLAGVTQPAVCKYRARCGIPAYRPSP